MRRGSGTVHQQLIKEGKVEPLTFKQLRSLERIDRKKAKEQKYFEIAKEAVIALGSIGQGAAEGVGRIGQGFFEGDAIAFAAKGVAGLAFLAWFINTYPELARIARLDTLWYSLQNPGTSQPASGNQTFVGGIPVTNPIPPLGGLSTSFGTGK